MPRFREFFSLLESYDVNYVVVGGAAMVLQGSSMLTADIDVLYERTPGNCARFAAALATANPRLRVENEPAGLSISLDAAAIRAGMNFTLLTDLGDVDIFGEIPGIGKYELALPLSETYELVPGHQTKVLSIAGLIAAKKAAGRPKDRAALVELEAMQTLRESHEHRED